MNITLSKKVKLDWASLYILSAIVVTVVVLLSHKHESDWYLALVVMGVSMVFGLIPGPDAALWSGTLMIGSVVLAGFVAFTPIQGHEWSYPMAVASLITFFVGTGSSTASDDEDDD